MKYLLQLFGLAVACIVLQALIFIAAAIYAAVTHPEQYYPVDQPETAVPVEVVPQESDLVPLP